MKCINFSSYNFEYPLDFLITPKDPLPRIYQKNSRTLELWRLLSTRVLKIGAEKEIKFVEDQLKSVNVITDNVIIWFFDNPSDPLPRIYKYWLLWS